MNIFEHVVAITPECTSLEIISPREYTADEIAYAIAGLTDLQRCLIHVKYGMYLSDLNYLGIKWWVRSLDHWKVIGPKTDPESKRRIINLSLIRALKRTKPEDNEAMLRHLSDQSVAYNLNPHVCGCCGGRKSVVIDPGTLIQRPDWLEKHMKVGGVVVCPECLGVGNKPQSARQRARIAGIQADTWNRNYEPLFAELVSMLAGIEGRAGDILSRRLGRRRVANGN